MRNCYRERLKAIRLGSAACVVLGVASLLAEYPTITRVAGGVILIGGVAAYLFWMVYLERIRRSADGSAGNCSRCMRLGRLPF